MPKFQCDGVELEIDDVGSLSIIKSWIEKRDSQINELTASNKDSEMAFEIGDKKYTDSSSMAKDFKSMWKDFQSLKEKYDAMCATAKDAKAKCDALEADVNARKDSIAKEDFGKALKERRQLERVASTHLDGITEEKLDSLSNREIMVEVISSRWDFDDLETRTDSEISAMYEVASRDAQTSRQHVDSAQKTLTKPVKEAHVDGAEYYTNTESAWQKTLGGN